MNDLIPFDESRWHRLDESIKAIQQPRTNFQIEKFVVGQHLTEVRRWHQCVLELQVKRQVLRRAEIQIRQLIRRAEKLEAKGTPEASDKAALLRLDIDDLSLAT